MTTEVHALYLLDWQLANLLSVGPATIRTWCKQKKLAAYRLPRNERSWRIVRSKLPEFFHENNLPLRKLDELGRVKINVYWNWWLSGNFQIVVDDDGRVEAVRIGISVNDEKSKAVLVGQQLSVERHHLVPSVLFVDEVGDGVVVE